MKEVQHMGFNSNNNTLGFVLSRTLRELAKIDGSLINKRNLLNRPELNRTQIPTGISADEKEIKRYYKFIADSIKYNKLFSNKDSESNFMQGGVSHLKILKSTLTAVLSAAFISMDYTKVYDDYTILNGLKDFLGEDDLPNLLNRRGDYSYGQDKTPKLEDLVEQHCKNDSEKGKFLQWLSDNGYEGIKTSNELIDKIKTIINDDDPNEGLVKQNVSNYLDEFFLDLSEGDIQNLNYIISLIKANAINKDFPSYVQELFVTYVHDEILDSGGEQEKIIEKNNRQYIKNKYESITDESKKKKIR